jgi:hypothetical protein
LTHVVAPFAPFLQHLHKSHSFQELPIGHKKTMDNKTVLSLNELANIVFTNLT